MKRKTSLKDIAKVVGVSIPLVSYVLSNKGKENRVSDKTAAKIRKVAQEMDYHPNLNARSLKTNKTRTLGVIVADISNPFFANLARTIEDQAYSQDYTVIFGSSDENKEKFERVLNFLKTRQVDGFIIAPPEGSKKMLLTLEESQIPFVLIDRYYKELNSKYVIIDNFKASIEATEYLLNKGNKRIASVVYNSKLAHFQDRHDGYVAAIKNAGLSRNFTLKINNASVRKDMKKGIKKLILEDEVDAIYFHSNTLAEEGLRQLMLLDKDLLKTKDVVAFDENSAYHFLEDFIPYVKQPIKKMGQNAVRILINTIENTTDTDSQVSLKTKLTKGNVKKKMIR